MTHTPAPNGGHRGGEILDAEQPFSIGVHVRLKNQALVDAARKLGGFKQLAAHLGIHYQTLVSWSNLTLVPNVIDPRHGKFTDPFFRREVEQKLLQLTGKTLDEIFPSELRGSHAPLKTQATCDVLPSNAARLLTSMPTAIPSPEDIAVQNDVKAAIRRALATMDERTRKIIGLRFGIDGQGEHTYQEIAAEIGLTHERIRQIEQKAIRRLQTPRLHKPLAEAAGYSP